MVATGNAEAIETMRKADTLVVDKIGTLTEGKPKLVSVVTAEATDEQTLLKLAASLERSSEHPLAPTIVSGTQERGVDLTNAGAFDSLTGKNISNVLGGMSAWKLAGLPTTRK